MLVDTHDENPAELSTDEKSVEIQKQLERLLADPHFSHSRRFPSFLRFVVEQTVTGNADSLKERTLGVEIFGKNADYDTATDPIVRVTAAEIRKRIAQYYQEPGRASELRISLPPGSYVPQFHWPTTNPEAPSLHVSSPPSAPTAEIPSVATPARTRHRFWLALAISVTLAALLSAGGAYLWQTTHRSAFEFFWGPILSTSDPVLFCIADQDQYTVLVLRDAQDPSRQVMLKDNLSAVIIDDLNPIVKIAGILQAHGKKYHLKGEAVTSLSDLQNGPTVFVGAFDNAWTLRLTRLLRFHFANNPEMTRFWIADSSSSSPSGWMIDRPQQQATNNYRDYGIAARFVDPNTGKIAIVAAGIGRGGTIAAGNFLTNPDDLALLENAAKAAGKKKNMEVVLSTQIIGGEPGTPKIVATYFW